MSRSQLIEALDYQLSFGRRLGTNLVELGILTPDQVAEQLSVRAQIPAPPRKMLDNIEVEALTQVPHELIKRYKVLPFHIEQGALHVAMIDPHDQAQLSALRAAATMDIQPYLLPELRMHYWLEHHCHIQRDIRFLDVGLEVARERLSVPIVPGRPDQGRRAPSTIAPLPEGEDLMDEATFEESHGMRTSDIEPAAAEEAQETLEELDVLESSDEAEVVLLDKPLERALSQTVSELEAELQDARSRDQIISAGLRLAARFVRTAALFVVHRGLVQGLQGEGDAPSNGRLQGILFPLETESILTAPAQSTEVFRGRPTQPHDIGLLEAMGRSDVAEVGIIPVRIKNRVVNVIYTDNGPDPIPQTCFAALSSVAAQIGAAYEALILKRREG